VTLPFADRLAAVYQNRMSFFELEMELYPEAAYPRYWKRGGNGGPPGGRMSLVAALTRRGILIDRNADGTRTCHGNLQRGDS